MNKLTWHNTLPSWFNTRVGHNRIYIYIYIHCIFVGLARTKYRRCIYGCFGWEVTEYTVIYGAYIQFWPPYEYIHRIFGDFLPKFRTFTVYVWFWPALLYTHAPHASRQGTHSHAQDARMRYAHVTDAHMQWCLPYLHVTHAHERWRTRYLTWGMRMCNDGCLIYMWQMRVCNHGRVVICDRCACALVDDRRQVVLLWLMLGSYAQCDYAHIEFTW